MALLPIVIYMAKEGKSTYVIAVRMTWVPFVFFSELLIRDADASCLGWVFNH